jgi:hypothetical protein
VQHLLTGVHPLSLGLQQDSGRTVEALLELANTVEESAVLSLQLDTAWLVPAGVDGGFSNLDEEGT